MALEKPPVKDNMYDLWSVMRQYKYLFNYYWERENSGLKIKTRKQIEDRIKYVLKHKLKQCGEVEALLWVLGVDSIDQLNL